MKIICDLLLDDAAVLEHDLALHLPLHTLGGDDVDLLGGDPLLLEITCTLLSTDVHCTSLTSASPGVVPMLAGAWLGWTTLRDILSGSNYSFLELYVIVRFLHHSMVSHLL